MASKLILMVYPITVFSTLEQTNKSEKGKNTTQLCGDGGWELIARGWLQEGTCFDIRIDGRLIALGRIGLHTIGGW